MDANGYNRDAGKEIALGGKHGGGARIMVRSGGGAACAEMLGICFFTLRENTLKGRSEEGGKGVGIHDNHSIH